MVAVGQSWGGNVVVRLAAEHPSLVAALALVDGGWIDLSAEFATWEECETRAAPAGRGRRMRPEQCAATSRATHPDWSAAAVEATLANLRVTPDGRLRRRLADPGAHADRAQHVGRPAVAGLPARSRRRRCCSRPCRPTPDGAEQRRAAVAKAAAALAHARVREYVGADHDLHAQHPAALAADLLALAPEP